MTDSTIHAWWVHHEAADSLAITACGRKLAEGDPIRAATTWGNSGVEVTCEECVKTLRAAGLGYSSTCGDRVRPEETFPASTGLPAP